MLKLIDSSAERSLLKPSSKPSEGQLRRRRSAAGLSNAKLDAGSIDDPGFIPLRYLHGNINEMLDWKCIFHKILAVSI